MTTGGRPFADLARSDEQHEQWLRKKLEASRRIAALGDQELFHSLAVTLGDAYGQNLPLPDHEELRELVENIVGGPHANDGQVVTKLSDPEVTVVVSGAIAKFICSHEPSLEVLAAAAKVEFYVDLDVVADLIARSERAGDWLSLLRKLNFKLGSINDDEYQASDELERWQTELKRPVPSWHEGNFPGLGGSAELLASAVLRALDVKAWLQFLDALPIPTLVEALLWYTQLDRTPESVLDWIRLAPSAYDQSGARTASALVFILERKAVGLLESAAERLSWTEGNGGSAISAGEEYRRELATAIKGRVDGETLLIELAARSLVKAQSGNPESKGARLRQDLQLAIGISYSGFIGTLSDLLRLSRTRAVCDHSRSLLGLWLLAPARAEREFPQEREEATHILRDSWPWLLEILCASDPGIAERYSPTVQWTERLGGLALAANNESTAELEAAWQALRQQRLRRAETRCERDAWSTSRFLIRCGFFASRLETDATKALDLWRRSMQMAISAWFARSNREPFAEVKYGLAHLAAGKLPVVDEPAGTFGYLVGEIDEFAEAALTLLDNTFDSRSLIQAASVSGIDAIEYLRLYRNKSHEEAVRRALAALSQDSDPAATAISATAGDEERAV
ncbi:MAG: hypothetical protein K0R38_1328 [Polyangiaceae bacterium]|nr:hypothetical protein [Polyangiaceae bacterium]